MRPSNTSNKLQNILDEFKDPETARTFLHKIQLFQKDVALMEVCGTHTMAFFRTGIRFSLPDTIRLVSGPGCPVCVTAVSGIEKAIGLAGKENTMLFCFGDMVKVPGISDSLESARARRGAHFKIMYSPLEALDYAHANPRIHVVLLGVGFETTIPLFASVLQRAQDEGIKNIFILPAFKLIPPAIDYLLSAGDIAINGFILPGHVSSIIGLDVYQFIVDTYHVPGVITGFEPVDMLEGIYLLLDMIEKNEPRIENQYTRFVSPAGNQKAQDIIYTVFEKTSAEWRGIQFDAHQLIDFQIDREETPTGCRCGDVIKGKVQPTQCPLFSSSCTPVHPIGPCMVSSEGTCAAYYKYGSPQ